VNILPRYRLFLFQPVLQLPWHANGDLHVRWPARVDSLTKVSPYVNTNAWRAPLRAPRHPLALGMTSDRRDRTTFCYGKSMLDPKRA